MPLVLRYFPKASHKEGKSLFSRFVRRNTGGKSIKKDNEANISTLKEGVMLRARKVYQPKVSRTPLLGVPLGLRPY